MATRCLIFALALWFLPAAHCDKVRAVPQVLKQVDALAGAAEPEIDPKFNTTETAGAAELMKALWASARQQYNQKDLQWAVAIFGLLLGLAALGDGKNSFKSLIVIIFGAAGFILALATFKGLWKDAESGLLWAYIVSLEIALGAGYIAWKGVDGMRYGMGMFVGFLLFQEAKVLTEVYGKTWLETPLSCGVAGTVLVLFGLFLFSDALENITLGFLAPVVGAGAVCASLGYFVMLGITFIPEESQKSIFKKGIAGTPHSPDIPTYEDFILMLFTFRAPEIVGFFHASDSETRVGSWMIHWDLWLGRFFLVIFAYLGIYVQCKKNLYNRKISKRVAGQASQVQPLLLRRKPAPPAPAKV